MTDLLAHRSVEKKQHYIKRSKSQLFASTILFLSFCIKDLKKDLDEHMQNECMHARLSLLQPVILFSYTCSNYYYIIHFSHYEYTVSTQ